MTDDITLIMSQAFQRPIAFHPVLARMTGSVTAGLFLSQALYWTPRTKTGWFYKSQAEWTEETTLTRYEQESARKTLRKLGLLQEKKQGVPARLYYCLNMHSLQECIIAHTRMRENHILEWGNSAYKDGGLPQPTSETTSETTSESTSENKEKDKDAHTREAECVSFFSEDAEDERYEETEASFQAVIKAGHEAMKQTAHPRVTPEDFQRLEAIRVDIERIGADDLERRKRLGIADDPSLPSLCETPIPDHETMGFECEHVQAAQLGLTDILGYKPKKGLEALRVAVHEYAPFDILAIAKAYTEAEPDRAKWGMGYIYSPKLIEGRIAAVHAPPVSAKDTRPHDHFERSPIYKVFPQDREWKELTGGDAMSMERVIGTPRTYEETADE